MPHRPVFPENQSLFGVTACPIIPALATAWCQFGWQFGWQRLRLDALIVGESRYEQAITLPFSAATQGPRFLSHGPESPPGSRSWRPLRWSTRHTPNKGLQFIQRHMQVCSYTILGLSFCPQLREHLLPHTRSLALNTDGLASAVALPLAPTH